MAFNKRTWLGRQGTGLNKFSIGGATPVTIVNQPDSVTQVGDALSAGNLNDLEDRIEDAFDDVDTELATKADEQDVTNLNNAITNLDHRLENIEQSKGDYIVSAYKDGSTTPSGKGKWCVVEGVEGVSRVDNNMVSDGATEVVQDGAYTGWVSSYTVDVTKPTTGRKYLCIFRAKVTAHVAVVKMRVTAGTDDVSADFSISSTGYQTFAWIYTGDGSYNFNLRIVQLSGSTTVSGDSIYIKDVEMKDLNVYFGGTIPSDADTIAKIQTNYPHLLLPTEYGTRIVDWTGNGVRAEGVNIWDEEWELGGIHGETGQPEPLTDRIRSKNFIPVKANTTYYETLRTWIYQYDVDHNYLGRETASSSNEFTTLANCAYIKFIIGGVTTYANDMQICLNSYPDKTTFHDYFVNTLSFPSISLKSAGSVREKKLLNVEVEIDGQKVQKSVKTNPLRRMTFDDNTYWQRSNDGVYFTDSVSGLYDENNLPFCPPYVAVSKASGNSDAYSKGNMTCCFRGTVPDRFYIRDDYAFVTMNYTAAQFKEYIKGKTLTFALATPDPDTYSDPILDNTLLTEAYGRMSTVQTGTVVDGISDLGFITL